MDSQKKILVFGIDGGTWTVLKPAVDEGYMPFVKSLLESGSSGILKSTIPAITPAAWGSFQTGKNPGKTGVFDFSSWDTQEKKSHYASSLNLGTTVWNILSDHQKRIGVLNVPMTYPPRPVNGYLITGLLTPSLESDFTYPKELKEQLLCEIPEYHIFNIKKNAELKSSEEYFNDFIQQMLSIMENRTRTALWLLEKEPLDVFMVHYQATDVLQHVYWQFLDESHPLYQPEKRTLIFEHFYKALDQKLKTVHRTFVEKNGVPLTIVISDHGFQTHHKRFNLGNWLEQEGYLNIIKNRQKPSLIKKITKTLRIGKFLSLFLSHKTIQNMDKRYISKTDFINWDKSKAYSVGRSNEGFIYLLPQNHEEKNRLAQDIKIKLLNLKDPQTDRPIVQKVHFKLDIYHGDKLENLPDLVIEPQKGYSFTGHYQFNADLFHTVSPQHDMHIGKHHPDGVFIASGPQILSGRNLTANIVDIAPTVIYAMGLPVSDRMDGSVLIDLFSEIHKNQHPIRKQSEESFNSGQASDSDYSKEDNSNIEQRLKDLGYL